MFLTGMMMVFLIAAAGTTVYLGGIVLSVILYILYALGAYRMFQKAGIPGWLAWIPFVNEYFIFKISWNPVYFWVNLAANILISFNTTDGHMNWIAGILWIVSIVIHIIYTQKLAASFGRSPLFGTGLFFFESVFIMILGFGSSIYFGPQDRPHY